jgi:hypothetical protein
MRRHTKASYGTPSSADLNPLIAMLQEVEAACHITEAEQVAHIQRLLLSIELDPSPSRYIRLNGALDLTMTVREHMRAMNWKPGRDDLSPLFDLDTLNA